MSFVVCNARVPLRSSIRGSSDQWLSISYSVIKRSLFSLDVVITLRGKEVGVTPSISRPLNCETVPRRCCRRRSKR